MVAQLEPETGYRWPVAVERTIEVPAQEVWAAISSPGNLELCHPFCASNPVRVWPGSHSEDEVHYLSGCLSARAAEGACRDSMAAAPVSACSHAEAIPEIRHRGIRLVLTFRRTRAAGSLRPAPVVFGVEVGRRLIGSLIRVGGQLVIRYRSQPAFSARA